MLEFPRTRLRFSLRTLLILVALIGIYLAVLTNRAHHQRAAIAIIKRSYDNQVAYDTSPSELKVPGWIRRSLGDDYFVNVTHVRLGGAVTGELLPELVDHLRCLPKLRSVCLTDAKLCDDDLRHLAKLTQISELYLYFPKEQVSGAGLKHLTSMSNLTELNLFGHSITNEALRCASQVHSLKSLSITSCNVDEKGLQFLFGCGTLEHLTLRSGQYGGGALTAIASLPCLKRLELLYITVAPPRKSISVEEFDRLVHENQIELVPASGLAIDRMSGLAGANSPSMQFQFTNWLKKQRPGIEVSFSWIN